jgi:hypothetical protein
MELRVSSVMNDLFNYLKRLQRSWSSSASAPKKGGETLDTLGHGFSTSSESAGFVPTDTLFLGDQERNLVNWITRRGEVSLDEVICKLGVEASRVEVILERLVADGFLNQLDREGRPFYYPRLASHPRKRHSSQIWDTLKDL